MFIRRTQTRSRVSGEPYATYRLVHSTRVGSAIKQTTLLNLGSHFDLPQVHWPALAQCIDELVHGQRSMLEASLPDVSAGANPLLFDGEGAVFSANAQPRCVGVLKYEGSREGP